MNVLSFLRSRKPTDAGRGNAVRECKRTEDGLNNRNRCLLRCGLVLLLINLESVVRISGIMRFVQFLSVIQCFHKKFETSVENFGEYIFPILFTFCLHSFQRNDVTPKFCFYLAFVNLSDEENTVMNGFTMTAKQKWYSLLFVVHNRCEARPLTVVNRGPGRIFRPINVTKLRRH